MFSYDIVCQKTQMTMVLTYYIFEKYSVVIGASGESLVCIVAAFAGELFLNFF